MLQWLFHFEICLECPFGIVDVRAHLKWKCYETKCYEMNMIEWLTTILRSISHSNQRKKKREIKNKIITKRKTTDASSQKQVCKEQNKYFIYCAAHQMQMFQKNEQKKENRKQKPA